MNQAKPMAVDASREFQSGMPDKVMHINDVHKSFAGLHALSDVDLDVRKGETHAIIGPNGAGKTTLFNLITGQLQSDGGSLVFNDENINKLPPYKICRKGIARSFQIANVFQRLPVFRNVQVSVLSQQKLSNKLFHPASQMAVEETNRILEGVGLLDKKFDVAGSLSHGDKRTLEIAIALGNEPELLILDEPTAGIDPAGRRLIREVIAELRERHPKTLGVLHKAGVHVALPRYGMLCWYPKHLPTPL